MNQKELLAKAEAYAEAAAFCKETPGLVLHMSSYFEFTARERALREQAAKLGGTCCGHCQGH